MNLKMFGIIAFLTISFVLLSGCIQPAVCGNAICELEENEASCPQDCQVLWWCGDGTCNQDETPESCPTDCGSPLPVCGNGTCDAGENAGNCASDCVSKASDGMSTHFEGETITGFKGRNNYAGQELELKIAAITQPIAQGPNAGYQTRFDLYNKEGLLIGSKTVGPGVDLRDKFLDSTGNYALDSSIVVKSIMVEPTTSRGVITLDCKIGGSTFCGQDGFYLESMNSCYFEGALSQSCDKVCEGRGGCVTRYEDSTDLVDACLHFNPGAADLEVDAYDKAFPYYTEEYDGNRTVCVSRKYPAPQNSCSASAASGQRTCKCSVKPAVCGDGACNGAETVQNCPQDCTVV